MTRQVVNDGTGDSISQAPQMKIYTDRYMIYAHPLPNDSLGAYGIGTYTMQDGKVTEYVFHTSEGGARNDTFQLDVSRRDGGYTQTIHFPPDSQGRNFVLVEEYDNVGKSVSSPLDGAWKMTEVRYISANGPARTDTRTQFKVYQSGHFIWVNTVPDSATNKPQSAFGYGTFEMNGDNQATERNVQSTYASTLVGQPVTLQLEFMGKDAYRQTLAMANGDKMVETYQRLK